MRYVFAAILAVVGLVMIATSRGLAVRVQRSNQAFFGHGFFEGSGWRTWNLFVARLVGGFMILGAVLLATGIAK